MDTKGYEALQGLLELKAEVWPEPEEGQNVAYITVHSRYHAHIILNMLDRAGFMCRGEDEVKTPGQPQLKFLSHTRLAYLEEIDPGCHPDNRFVGNILLQDLTVPLRDSTNPAKA